jgi:hypothetical protein
MTEHLKTIVLVCILAIVLTCIRFIPGITMGVMVFVFIYAIIYTDIKESSQNNKEHENGKG